MGKIQYLHETDAKFADNETDFLCFAINHFTSFQNAGHPVATRTQLLYFSVETAKEAITKVLQSKHINEAGLKLANLIEAKLAVL